MLIDEELTLKKLEVFLAFMRTGNLARAAAELQTSNVSVHRAIHSLESALRCPLFKHEGRNLTPLESAYVLEERAQKLIQDVVETVRLTREAAGFSAERFKLGSLYSLTVKTVPQLIMGLKIRRSELNIDLILGSNFDLLYKLKNMEVDAILVSLDESVNDPDCEQIPLFSDDIFLATPADSKFAQRAEVDLAEVRDETFITLTQGFATHQDGNRVFKQAGFEPKVAMQVNDIFTLLSMVSSGVGYALLPGEADSVAGKVSVAAAHWRGVLEGQGARSELAGAVGGVPDVCQSPSLKPCRALREQARSHIGMHFPVGASLLAKASVHSEAMLQFSRQSREQ
jgi:LysR family malonate utilization transcriptional regulator